MLLCNVCTGLIALILKKWCDGDAEDIYIIFSSWKGRFSKSTRRYVLSSSEIKAEKEDQYNEIRYFKEDDTYLKYNLHDSSNVYSVLRTLLLRVGSEGRLGTWVRSDLWKLVCSTHLSYIFIRTRYTWAPIYVLLKLPTQYKLVMPIRQFKAMWKSSEIGRRLQVCPCWLLTSNIIFVHSTSSLFRLLSTPKLLRRSTISRFSPAFRNELHSNAPTMGGDGDHHADQHHGLPHQHLLLLRRPLRRQVLRRRRDRVRPPHPGQPPHTPTIYACCGFCGREVRTEGIIFEFEFRIRIKVFFLVPIGWILRPKSICLWNFFQFIFLVCLAFHISLFQWCVRIAVLSLILGGTTRLLATLPKDAQIGSMEVVIVIKISIKVTILIKIIIIRVEQSSFWFLLVVFSSRLATPFLWSLQPRSASLSPPLSLAMSSF